MTRPTRVLIIDDSALIRALLTEMIASASDFEVVGAAPDPHVARELIKRLDPDVITLDVEMPRMNGLDFLEKLMRLRPMPVLMISTMTRAGSDITLRALELGAVDFIPKPQLGIEAGLREMELMLHDKLRAAAVAKVRRLSSRRFTPQPRAYPIASSERIFAIGASTGGTEAISQVLHGFAPDAPGTLIAQHMPPVFTASFADRLDRSCRISVKEAEDGERVLPGHAYIAPGDRHLMLARAGSNYTMRLSEAEPVNRHRPSVDVLFHSVAKHAAQNAVGVILTGMGCDGAAGLLQMRRARAFTIAQNEETSTVYGMPRAAVELDAALAILPLDEIAESMMRAASSQAPRYRT